MRRIKRTELTLTLFPFMDVLNGVIGVLILIVCALALLGINQSTIVIDIVTGIRGSHPVFLECLDDRVVIHDGDLTEEVHLGDTQDIVLGQLVSRLSGRNYKKNRYVLAIRPSGVQTYFVLDNLMSEAGITFGFEPMSSDQKIKVRTKG